MPTPPRRSKSPTPTKAHQRTAKATAEARAQPAADEQSADRKTAGKQALGKKAPVQQALARKTTGKKTTGNETTGGKALGTKTAGKKSAGTKNPGKQAAATKAPRTKGGAERAEQRSVAGSVGGDRLTTYQSKRDFTVTSEPSGDVSASPAAAAATRRRFVVQRHRASRLHYDFRLEAGGVLLSWAVPKGPTLDPDVRRMAVHVEDHPVDYFDFEGVIPAGEYGGGDVIVWDWGTYEMADDADPIDSTDRGSLHFDIQGDKLAGRFALVRSDRSGAKEQWLMIHKHDAAAVAGWDPEDHPTSVKTGRTNDDVRATSPA